MSGHVVHRVARSQHRCKLPGWWQRRKLDLDFGSIWECVCGERWRLTIAWGRLVWDPEPDA